MLRVTVLSLVYASGLSDWKDVGRGGICQRKAYPAAAALRFRLLQLRRLADIMSKAANAPS